MKIFGYNMIQITSSTSDNCSINTIGIKPQIQDANQIKNFPDAKDITIYSSCSNEQNRILQNSKCVCKQGYYEQISIPTCLACLVTCSSCKDTIGCLSYFENASLQNGQCVCNSGYFLNDSFRCQSNHTFYYQFLTCYFSENYCTSCIDQNQILPNCSCPNGIFFDPDSQSCKNCNNYCQTCSYSNQGKNQFTSCAAGFINPPLCQKQCKLYELYDYDSMECVPLVCDSKFITCERNSSNCLTCKRNRINPPFCQCELHYYDDEQSTNCITCPDEQYFGNIKDNQKGFLPCHFSCKHCTGPKKNQCSECQNDTFIQSSDGYCQCIGANKTLYKDQLDNNLPKCVTSLSINLSIYINSEFQQIYRINFSDSIQKRISSDLIMQNLSIYLEAKKLSQDKSYLLQNQIKIIFNGDNNTVLDIRCVQNPIFIKMVQDNVDYSSSQRNLAQLKAASESVQNNPFVQFFTTYYFFLYILSTLQPTLLFLLAQIELPLNIEFYLKILGQFVFSKNQFFSWYQIYKTTQLNKNEYKILNLDFSQQLQNEVPSNQYFQYIGFLNNFLHNTQIPSLLFMIFIVFHLACILIYKFKYDQRHTNQKYNLKQLQYIIQINYLSNKNQCLLEQLKQNTQEDKENDVQLLLPQNVQSQSKFQERLESIIILLRKLMITNLESNFVVYFVSVYLQFQNLEGDYFANRYSIYIM
ncbi:hypothetical protein ABPG72_016738 [Tetrahymena utriculariae]